jgi:hypothetical protein
MSQTSVLELTGCPAVTLREFVGAERGGIGVLGRRMRFGVRTRNVIDAAGASELIETIPSG